MQFCLRSLLVVAAVTMALVGMRAEAPAKGAGTCCVCTGCEDPPVVCFEEVTVLCERTCLFTEDCSDSMLIEVPCSEVPQCSGIGFTAPAPLLSMGALPLAALVLGAFGAVGIRRIQRRRK
jgi:hypothetical protein